ncbi:hypothetical protein BH10BAC5_BH10BAC5_19230 [soil metagenome]
MKPLKKLFLIFNLLVSMTVNLYSQSWVQQNSGTSKHLRDVYFINQNTGYIVGGSNIGIVLKTTNGGNNWNQINIGSDLVSYSVLFLNAQTGFIAHNTISKTTDSGSNWEVTSGNSSCHDIFFLNNNEGYACGSAGIILKSTNGGDNWITLGSGVNHELNSIYFINSLTGYSAGYFANEPTITYRILRTTNGGNFWTTLSQGSSLSTTQKMITFSDSTTGYMIDANSIYRSSNSGNNWSVIFTLQPYTSLYAIHFPSPRFGYVVGDHGVILKTTDYGLNWSSMGSGVTNILYSVFFTDTLTGYAVGESGIIIKTTNGGVTFTHPISTETPNHFSLSQNYPNPFNPKTKLKFELPSGSFARLIVFDVLGRELETLVNENLNAGKYEINWNPEKQAGGIYYYRLNAGNFSETKKMLLIK